MKILVVSKLVVLMTTQIVLVIGRHIPPHFDLDHGPSSFQSPNVDMKSHNYSTFPPQSAQSIVKMNNHFLTSPEIFDYSHRHTPQIEPTWKDSIFFMEDSKPEMEPEETEIVKKFQKLRVLSRPKRAANSNSPIGGSLKEEDSDQNPECNVPGSRDKRRNLVCYQCRSNYTDTDPVCDTVTWKFVRPSERFGMRTRCRSGDDHFCVKTVRRGISKMERITIRSCHGPGPIRTQVDGKFIPLREGCITYYEGDYSTTTCFCEKEVCNLAGPFWTPGDIFQQFWLIFSIFLLHLFFRF